MAERSAGRKVYHVVPNSSAERWAVSQENGTFRREFDTQEEAVEFAKLRAREAEWGQIKVHQPDGNMDYESTYGEEPARSPG